MSEEQLTKVRDIGNMDPDLESPIFRFFDIKSIIQVFSSRWIDSEDSVRPQIVSRLELSLGDPDRQS